MRCPVTGKLHAGHERSKGALSAVSEVGFKKLLAGRDKPKKKSRRSPEVAATSKSGKEK
jgi:hypothetical protein